MSRTPRSVATIQRRAASSRSRMNWPEYITAVVIRSGAISTSSLAATPSLSARVANGSAVIAASIAAVANAWA